MTSDCQPVTQVQCTVWNERETSTDAENLSQKQLIPGVADGLVADDIGIE
jgi:hypothetical protein